MLSVDEAQSVILASVSPLPSEPVAVAEALGCVLAERVTAPIPLPPFDNSAMDGFAVVAHDTRGASAEAPCALKVIESLPAGATPGQRVESGTAARIMTGAPLPPGADAVVMVERTRPGRSGTVEILAQTTPGANIRHSGEDIMAGQTALSPGQLLGPAELGLAAALGLTHLTAVRHPRVAILTTGSELVPPGRKLKPGAIYDSNQTALAAAVTGAGGTVVKSLHVADEERAVEDALRACLEADVVLAAGGISVGDYDCVKVALERLGEVKFRGVRMKPGKPVAFATVRGLPVFGLPGNPVSALVTFEVLVAPALCKMSGRRDCLSRSVFATLSRGVRHEPGRREYCQAVTSYTEGGFRVQPAQKRGSAMLTSAVGANSLLVIPEESKTLRAGERVTVILLASSRGIS
jgi:molybdopterin molybdotransferase